MNKEEIIKELDKQNRELGEELSLTKDKLDKTLFEKEHYKKLYSVVKKQKDDVVKYMKNYIELEDAPINERIKIEFKELLRMLGEIDNE